MNYHLQLLSLFKVYNDNVAKVTYGSCFCDIGLLWFGAREKKKQSVVKIRIRCVKRVRGRTYGFQHRLVRREIHLSKRDLIILPTPKPKTEHINIKPKLLNNSNSQALTPIQANAILSATSFALSIMKRFSGLDPLSSNALRRPPT